MYNLLYINWLVYTHTHMKFQLHGHSSPDPKRSRVPSLVGSGSAARITFQLHAHTYTSSVKLHYNTTKTQTTTTIIFVSQYILQLLGCSGWGSHKYQSLWSFTQNIMEYQWVCCPLSSTHPLPNPPTLLLRFPPSPTARTSRTRSRRSHFLFFITGTCCLFVCFIIGRLRSGIFSFITGRLCSCCLICVLFTIGSVTAYTFGPSSTRGKKKFNFFWKFEIVKKKHNPLSNLKTQWNIYIYYS